MRKKLVDVTEEFEWWQVYDAAERAKELRKQSGYTMEFEVVHTLKGKLRVQYEMTAAELSRYLKEKGLS